MDNQKQDSEDKKINKHDFYFETPLYEFVDVEKIEENIFSGDVDAYSGKNGIDTTYSIFSHRVEDYPNDYFYNFYRVTLTCKRRNDDTLGFFIYKNSEGVMKMGQWPSLADLQFAEIGKKYDKFLSREDMKEFKRAIGLAANGIGVGSFVYLRRVFENLIYETFNQHEHEIETSKENFSRKRMEDKVEELKNYLPSQLIEMKSIYSILSKGLHELEEQTCLKYFPPLKLSIELILEQKIDMEEKIKRDADAKKQIQEISREINS